MIRVEHDPILIDRAHDGRLFIHERHRQSLRQPALIRPLGAQSSNLFVIRRHAEQQIRIVLPTARAHSRARAHSKRPHRLIERFKQRITHDVARANLKRHRLGVGGVLQHLPFPGLDAESYAHDVTDDGERVVVVVRGVSIDAHARGESFLSLANVLKNGADEVDVRHVVVRCGARARHRRAGTRCGARAVRARGRDAGGGRRRRGHRARRRMGMKNTFVHSFIHSFDTAEAAD